MYVIAILTPSVDDESKMVKTYYCRQVTDNFGVRMTEWDEDIKYAKVFMKKLDAKIVQSYLRTLIGSDNAKIELRKKFSTN